MAERGIRSIVGLLLKNDLITKAEYEEFVYVLLGDFESVMVVISILTLGVISRRIIPTISFLLCFFSLRKRTGGYHLNTYAGCYICTLCLYLFITKSACYLMQHINFFVSLAMIAGCIVMMLGSVNHPNMGMGKDELAESAMIARIIVGIECLFILSLRWLGNAEMIVVYSGMAIVLCAALLILAKLLRQEVIEG